MKPTQCSIDGCDRKHEARGWCKMHYRRWKRHGDPLTVKPYALVGHDGDTHWHWTGEAASYIAAHKRLNKERGKARDQSCQYCRAPARHWAYNHCDPNERMGCPSRRRIDYGPSPYSLDPMMYIPLCPACHYRLDSRHLNLYIKGAAS